MASLSIKIDAREARRDFAGIHRRTVNARALWRAVAQMMLESVRVNFRRGGRPRRWKRRKDNLPHPLLIKSGALLQSIKPRSTRSTASLSTPIVYAATHQFGRGPIPARPFLIIPKGDESRIARHVERHILGRAAP